MRTLKLTLAYDGTAYVGWQRQAAGESIQGLLEQALMPFEGGPVTVHGAGRTDAGVHALAQVASVRLTALHDTTALRRGLNAVLPPDIRVLSVEDAPEPFHARFDAVGKIYEYRIVNAEVASPFLRRYAWHVPGSLDLDAITAGARMLAGRHDFSSFQGSKEFAGSAPPDTVRTIHAIDWRQAAEGQPLVMTVRGDGFLRHMVRAIAGTLVDVGRGRWPPSQLADMLEARDRRAAGRTAPACGLFLVRVLYAGDGGGTGA